MYYLHTTIYYSPTQENMHVFKRRQCVCTWLKRSGDYTVIIQPSKTTRQYLEATQLIYRRPTSPPTDPLVLLIMSMVDTGDIVDDIGGTKCHIRTKATHQAPDTPNHEHGGVGNLHWTWC